MEMSRKMRGLMDWKAVEYEPANRIHVAGHEVTVLGGGEDGRGRGWLIEGKSKGQQQK